MPNILLETMAFELFEPLNTTLFWNKSSNELLQTAVEKFFQQQDMNDEEMNVVKTYMWHWGKAFSANSTVEKDIDNYFNNQPELNHSSLWCMLNFLLSHNIDPF